MHCNINEKVFSWMLFLTRFITACVLLYIAAGCLLFYREYLYNAAALGIPFPVQSALLLVIVQILLALVLVLGWMSRWAAMGSIFCLSLVGFIFFGADLNKIYVALISLLITALLPTLLMGSGKLSLDYNRARRRAQKIFRG